MNKGQRRAKADFNVLDRIALERDKRGWSDYRLAESSGIPASTISTWNRRKIEPGIASIEKICDGFGITLSQFFGDERADGLSEEQRELLDLWFRLSPKQRSAVKNLILAFTDSCK